MGSDSISKAPVPAFSKDMPKKKRTNRLAKLKQSKLDVRREQWLSQVKNKGCKMDSNGKSVSLPSSFPRTDQGNMRSKGLDIEESCVHDSDTESLMSSPVGSSSSQNDSIKDLHGSGCSSASSRCSSGSVSEAEDDDGCLDDWEVVADALIAEEKQHNLNVEPPPGFKTEPRLVDPEKNFEVGLLKTERKGMVSGVQPNSRVWRPDDAFRPESLPDLLKQPSAILNSGCGAISWTWQSIMSEPSPCPICYEDLDVTDSSFLPCPCGFRLCLFCHKRILEADGGCPGCRKQYDPIKVDVALNEKPRSFGMGHTFRMSMRS